MEELHVVQVPPSDLIRSEYNPRKWSCKTLEDIKASIAKFGFVDPVIANKTQDRKNVLIGGHLRVEAALDLKLPKIPVVYLDIPDIACEKELNLRLNRNKGEWDYDLLKEFDIDLLLDVGFDDTDLGDIWDDDLAVDEDGFDVDKELEQIKEPKSKLGDIYALGKHKIICGDSTKFETYEALLGDERVDLVLSDSPYNIGLDYNAGVGGKKNKYGSGIVNDSKTDEEFAEFTNQCLSNGVAFCKKDAHYFYYCDQNNIGLIQDQYRKVGIKPQRVCMWIKGTANPTPQIAFNKVYEPCVYGTIGKPHLNADLTKFNEIFNREVENGKRSIDDIEDIIDIWLQHRLAGHQYMHPTAKPPTLHEKALRRCSKIGDIVLDQFAGSGSTLIACHQLKRRAYLIELDPIFVDLILKRYEDLAGEKPKKLN